MKTIIIFFAISSVLLACNSKSSETSKDVVGLDTTGLYKINMSADTANVVVVPGTTNKKVVETRAPDGTVTTITTTTQSDKPVTKPKTQAATVTTGTTKTSGIQPVVVQKKGWSSRAKGAVIGGVGGAVVGAAVSKKKGTGAIIGGTVGAAGGYILGNEKDKKTGR